MNFLSLLNAISGGYIALIVIGAVVLIALILLFCIVPMKVWFVALFSKAHLSMSKLTSLKFRKINPMLVVEPYILAKKSKLDLSFHEIESLYLTGGNCKRDITALIFATSANLPVDFDYIKAIELSGQDPVEVLESAVKPRSLSIYNVKAISQDNIEIVVDVNFTIKMNFKTFLGGLGEDTIKSRIQKQIISNIALSPNHQLVLTYPHKLLSGILQNKLDEGCSYTIESVEVAKVDLGRDVGAEMIAKNAQKDIALAQVEAERMKNTAIIREQQMKAKAQEMKSVVLSAEAEVPKAIAEAIKEGRFSIMDYYKLMNLQADTAMRRSIINRDDGVKGV